MNILHSAGHRGRRRGPRLAAVRPEERPVVLANIVETSRIRAVEHDLAALDALFASSPLGIALFDTDKRFVRCQRSPGPARPGPASRNIIGKYRPRSVPLVDGRGGLHRQSTVLETGRPIVDVVMPAPDGPGSRSVSYSRLTSDEGEVLGVSCVIMDITERREALEKIEAARERLALLDDVGVGLGDRFDVNAISQALATQPRPPPRRLRRCDAHRCRRARGDLPDIELLTGTPLFQLGIAARDEGPTVNRMLRVGQDVPFLADSFFGRTLATGVPHVASSRANCSPPPTPATPRCRRRSTSTSTR